MDYLSEDKDIQALKVAEIAAFFYCRTAQKSLLLGPQKNESLGCFVLTTEAHLSDEIRQNFIDEKNHFFGKFDEMGVRWLLDIIRSDKVFLFMNTNEIKSYR